MNWFWHIPANGLHAFTLDQWVAWQWLHIDNLWLFHAWCMSGDGPWSTQISRIYWISMAAWCIDFNIPCQWPDEIHKFTEIWNSHDIFWNSWKFCEILGVAMHTPTHRHAHRHTDRQTHTHTHCQTDIQTYRHTYRHTDRHTSIQTDRQTDRQTLTDQTDRHRDRHKQTDRQTDRKKKATYFSARRVYYKR